MNAECLRIADQLRRAFAGDPWHGPPLSEVLAGITPEQASSRPLPSAHSIWELALHIGLYAGIATEAIEGIALPKLYGTEKDWPAVSDNSPEAWSGAVTHLLEAGETLAKAIEGFSDARLEETVLGRDYDFYYLFHGVVQHSLYHGGQITLLKGAMAGKAAGARWKGHTGVV